MGAKERFLTRQKANAGVRLPLYDPKTGEQTDHWLLILGRDSDASRNADLESRREMRKRLADVNPKDKRAVEEVQKEIDQEAPARVVEQIATLVADWSWRDEEPCTRENVIAFLKDAPQVADAIDSFTSDRVSFFGAAAKTSSPSPKQTSDSTGAAQDQTKQSETT
jgi:hypothetical protein